MDICKDAVWELAHLPALKLVITACGINRRSDPTPIVDVHHCASLYIPNIHRHKVRNHCDMYIRVKKRHDNHDFQPHALVFPPKIWISLGEKTGRERGNHAHHIKFSYVLLFISFFFFRPSVPCAAYVLTFSIPKGMKPRQRLVDPDNWDSRVLLPERKKGHRNEDLVVCYFSY